MNVVSILRTHSEESLAETLCQKNTWNSNVDLSKEEDGKVILDVRQNLSDGLVIRTITLNKDTQRPTLVRASLKATNAIEIEFSESMRLSALNPSLYISSGIGASTLSPSPKVVVFGVQSEVLQNVFVLQWDQGSIDPNEGITIEVDGVSDLAGNTLKSSITIPASSPTPTPSPVPTATPTPTSTPTPTPTPVPFGRINAVNTVNQFFRTLVIDSANQQAYMATCGASGYAIERIDLTTFNTTGLIVPPTSTNCYNTGVLDASNEYVYFGEDSWPGRIVKIRTSDFSYVGTLVLAAGEYELSSSVIYGNYLYFAFNNYWDGNGPKLVKIDLNTFSEVGTLNLLPGEMSFWSLTLDEDHGMLYMGGFDLSDANIPTTLVKVDLNSFTRVSSIVFPSDETGLTTKSCVIDRIDSFLYCGVSGNPANTSGKIVKIRLSDFLRVDAITLNSGENFAGSAAIDSPTRVAYFATNTSQGTIIKLDLPSFIIKERLDMISGESSLRDATFDSVTRVLYYGASGSPTTPGLLIKFFP